MIEIPGYRLLRPLGHGGVATVHLAIQLSVDREVAIKLMSPALLVDPEFEGRFLREARIAARLHHRHVVGIYDVGRAGVHPYIAMEFLSGGTILAANRQPRERAFALRVVREIAEALAYVHAHGYVHRDVSSDNILLRADGSAVITDFGIAETIDASSPTSQTGTVVGTPNYMSPEQAAGGVVDGRSDLYSLGIVLHELLTGKLPKPAEENAALKLADSGMLAPLPSPHRDLQPLLDRLLATDPQQRFQDARAVISAVVALEQTASNERPTERQPAQAAADFSVGERLQPELGELDQLGLDGLIETDAPRSAPRNSERPRRQRGIGVVLLVVALVVGMLWLGQDQLRALLPQTELNRLLAEGQQALATGRISGGPDSALELFQRARDLEQDNEVARSGLASVAEQLLAQGIAAVERDDLVAAQETLNSLRELRGGGAAIDQLTRRIAEVESTRNDAESILADAESALAAGRILGDDGAVAGYRKLLADDVGSAIGRAGLIKAAAVLAQQAAAARDAADLAGFADRIDDIASIQPDFAGLADLRGQLASLREQARTENERLLALASQQLRAGVISDGDDSALALFGKVLAREAGNVTAREGLRRVAQALLISANAALEDRDGDSAARLLAQVAALAPGSAELDQAQRRLQDLRERQQIDAEHAVITPADAVKLKSLIEQGRHAARRGALMDPPLASAYDHYRAALAIDPTSADAMAGLAQLGTIAGQRYDSAFAAGDLSAALAELVILRQLAPADASLPQRSAQLLQTSLDQARSGIAAGHYGQAQRAVDLARRLDPQHPRLAELEREVAALARD